MTPNLPAHAPTVRTSGHLGILLGRCRASLLPMQIIWGELDHSYLSDSPASHAQILTCGGQPPRPTGFEFSEFQLR